MRPGLTAALVSILASSFTGCGGSRLQPVVTHEVKGKVLLADGKPLAKGRVVLVPVEGLTPSASGDLGADGAFTLTTRDSGDGAAVGKYKVRIEPPQDQQTRKYVRPAFPLKYVDEDSSGLFVTIDAKTSSLDPIVLK